MSDKNTRVEAKTRLANALQVDRDQELGELEASKRLAENLKNMDKDEWLLSMHEWLGLPPEKRKAKLHDLSEAFMVMGGSPSTMVTLEAMALLKNSLPEEKDNQE